MGGTLLWGALKKASTDETTIEERIAEMITDHDNDPSAHLGETGALQSHKASEIIDHAALSIITDKIAENQILPSQQKLGARIFINGLQSLDSWKQTKVGAGSAIGFYGFGRVDIYAGDVSGASANLTLETYDSSQYANGNPILEVTAESTGGEGQADLGFAIGCNDPFTTTVQCVGVRYKQANNKIYAFVVSSVGAVKTCTEYEIYNGPIGRQIYRIEIKSAENKVYFYLAEVLKYTFDYTGKTIMTGDNVRLSFKTKRVATGDSAVLSIQKLFFTTDY